MSWVHAMVVAGEASGDSHAAELVAELSRRRPELRFFGMGGPKLKALGTDLLYGANEISVMGFTEVLPRVRRLWHILNALARAARRRKPAFALLVDIPDFNLRLAKSLKHLGIPVVYYVSPMVWAWRKGRVRQIAERVDRMLCILPFEEAFYRDRGVEAEYVGSPVISQLPAHDSRESFRRALGLSIESPTLALLPGSRVGEIRRILPALVRASELISTQRPHLQVVVSIAPGMDQERIHSCFSSSNLKPMLVAAQAAQVVGASDIAVVTSGTAALEAALMERPLVVVYRASWLNYVLGRMLISLPHISLPNLLAERQIVPELLQKEMSPERIAAEVDALWSDPKRQSDMLEALKSVHAVLGASRAATRAADAIVRLLESNEQPGPAPAAGLGAGKREGLSLPLR